MATMTTIRTTKTSGHTQQPSHLNPQSGTAYSHRDQPRIGIAVKPEMPSITSTAYRKVPGLDFLQPVLRKSTSSRNFGLPLQSSGIHAFARSFSLQSTQSVSPRSKEFRYSFRRPGDRDDVSKGLEFWQNLCKV